METQVNLKKEKAIRSFKFVREKVPALLRYGTVAALTLGGIGLMMGGGLAWIANEIVMFFALFVSGSIFVATGGASFLKCLDEQ